MPREEQHRVLFWGIVAAMVLRAVFVALGAAIVAQFDWLLYLFGIFLIVTGVRMVFGAEADPTCRRIARVKWMMRHLRVTNDLERERFFLVRPRPSTGRPAVHATRLFLAFMAINVADIVFAVDSVPAVLSMTQDLFLVYTSNIFAILGLRALYFVIDALIARFRYLKAGPRLPAVFIGVVIFYERLIGDFNNVLTMVITFAAIGVAILASLAQAGPRLTPRRAPRRGCNRNAFPYGNPHGTMLATHVTMEACRCGNVSCRDAGTGGVIAWAAAWQPDRLWPRRQVDLELVLAVDVSRSMDASEQQVQREGYIEAIKHPEVVAAIKSRADRAYRRHLFRMGRALEPAGRRALDGDRRSRQRRGFLESYRSAA